MPDYGKIMSKSPPRRDPARGVSPSKRWPLFVAGTVFLAHSGFIAWWIWAALR